jgi:hypothetical protein
MFFSTALAFVSEVVCYCKEHVWFMNFELAEDSGPLRCYALSSSEYFSAFRMIMVPSSSWSAIQQDRRLCTA